MKLSIITINFNNRDGLQQTINSVVKQTFTDFEWIVIDGGSTDGSLDLIETQSSRFSYWVSEPDKGIYNAMNKGLEKASGEYVQFLNSGDAFVDERVLESVFNDEGLSDVNYGNQWCVENGVIVEKRSYPDTMSLAFLFSSPLGHQASFIKRAFAQKCPYREKYSISGDRAFFLELYLSGAVFHHINLPIVFFDTDGIGSCEATREQRCQQLRAIKCELLTDQVVDDIETLMAKADEYDFVMRVCPLRLVYLLFKWIQKLKNKLR